MKPLAPFGTEAIKFYRPMICIFAGTDCWENAAFAHRSFDPGYVLALPPDTSPNDWHWPVEAKYCEIVWRDATINSIQELIDALMDSGALCVYNFDLEKMIICHNAQTRHINSN